MPSAINVGICACAAFACWTMIGFAVGQRIVPGTLALPFAPALGWAIHSALALPLYRLTGFSSLSVGAVSITACAMALVSLRFPARSVDDSSEQVFPWTYLLIAALAVAPAVALFPKISADGSALAPAIFDHSKVAIIDDMARLGLPPGNPFLGEASRNAALVYYYLWHFSAAELRLALHASGWEADIALTAFTAFASLSTIAGLTTWLAGRPAGLLSPLFAFAASLHPWFELIFGIDDFYSAILPPTGLAGWLFQATWAPQHIMSATVALIAIFMLAMLAYRPTIIAAIALGLTAAAAYESSLWIALVLAPAALFVGALGLVRCPQPHRVRFAATSALAVTIAVILAYPFLHDQLQSAAARGGGSPIAFRPYPVFNSVVFEEWYRWLDVPGYWLVLLPIEFPAIVFTGTIALIAGIRTARGLAGEVTIALGALALTSVLTTAFFTITFAHNNDLGWRAILPGVFVLIIFAAGAIPRWLATPRLRVAASAALILLMSGFPKAVLISAENWQGRPSAQDQAFAATPELWAAVRRHTGIRDRIANNPSFMDEMTPWPGNISWALFADRRSCYAGKDLVLPFTTLSSDAVDGLDELFGRIFNDAASAEDIHTLATRYQCRVAVMTAQDGAWAHDPFARSADYKLAEEKPGEWKIYRATAAR